VIVAHQIVWCDIPVLNLDRSIRFYSAVLGSDVKRQEYPGMAIGLLPSQGEDDVSGCLNEATDNKPSSEGPLIYLNVEGRLDDAVAAVTPNGGKVLQPRHAIGPYGFRAVILDSEGNRVALHSH
jgi:predicted enzyme related to lactoylglutathione lyase